MKLIAMLLALTLIHFNLASAQPTLPPELKDQVNTIIGQAINGVTIFTSQSTVSSGSFVIDEKDQPDTDVEVIRLPFSYNFTENGTLIPFVEGNVGYFKVTEQIPPAEGEGLNDFSRIKTLSASLGGGVEIKPLESLSIIPAFSFSYSHTRNYYDYNNQFSQEIVAPFGKQVFGWFVDTMTYIPSMRVEYEAPIGKPTLRLWTKYSQLFNNSGNTNSPTIEIDSNTGLWQNSIGVKVPLDQTINEKPLAIRSAITRTDVYSAGRHGLEFGYFYEWSWELVTELKEAFGPIKEFSVGGSYSFADDFSGWRVGFGYDF